MGGSGGNVAATFQTTECGKCVKSSCDQVLADCQTDPSCTSYLDCLYKCPVDSNGNADAACDAACVPTGSSSESTKKQRAVGACRLYGPGSDCPACAIP